MSDNVAKRMESSGREEGRALPPSPCCNVRMFDNTAFYGCPKCNKFWQPVGLTNPIQWSEVPLHSQFANHEYPISKPAPIGFDPAEIQFTKRKSPPVSESANREPQACRLCENPKEYELHTCNPKLLDDSYQEFDDYHKFQDTAIPSRLPFEAIKVCVTFLLQRFVKRQCDSEASSDCERCSVVALARWFLDAERELQELRAQIEWLLANFCDTHQQICSASSSACGICEAASLRGLVERMQHSLLLLVHDYEDHTHYCALCGANSRNVQLQHLPACLISEAEAAIKEPHK